MGSNLRSYKWRREASHTRAAIAFNEHAIRVVRDTIQPVLLSYADTLLCTAGLFEAHVECVSWAVDYEWGHEYFIAMNEKAARMRSSIAGLMTKARRDMAETARLT